MKTFFFINLYLHSVADIITNSSSELFVCNTEKTKEQIEEMFNILAQVTGHHGVGSIKVFEGLEGLKSVVEELDLCYLSDDGFYNIIRRFVPWRIKLEIPRIEYKWDSSWSYDDTLEKRQAIWQADAQRHEAQKQSLLTWIDDNADVLAEHVKFVTTVESESDNSIPYELFNIIESQLHATRFHLG